MSQLQIPSVRQAQAMHNEFTAVIDRVDDDFVAHCPEIPGVHGQGRTKMGALVDLREAVARVLNERRCQAKQQASNSAVFDTISVE